MLSVVAFRNASGVRVRAPAKLNLFFEVLGKRSDGFHEIETLMAPIDLCDDLLLEVDPTGGISVACTWAVANLRGRHATLGELPASESNLATRALRLLQKRAAISLGARVRLIKRIPAAAGLGGGSADAAAALYAGNVAWKLGWSLEQLSQLAAELGSDAPFFLHRAAAVCLGRGEQVRPVRALGNWPVVVVRPPVGLSTAEVYRDCKTGMPPNSAEPLVDALRRGDNRQLAAHVANRLQAAAESLSPWIVRLRLEFEQLNLPAAQMSGSGSSYFGICRSRRHARRVAARLRGRGVGNVWVVQMGPAALGQINSASG